MLSSISLEDPPSVKAILTYSSDVDVQAELLHLRSIAYWSQVVLLTLYCCFLTCAIILLAHLIMGDAPGWRILLATGVVYGLLWGVSKAYENNLQPLYWVKEYHRKQQSARGQ